MDATTLVNGQLSSHLDVWDRGLAYGDGLFETVALNHGQVQLWPLHRQRLMSGLLSLKLVKDATAAAYLVQLIMQDIQAAYALFEASQGVIKVIVTRGSGGRGYAAPSIVLPTRIVIFSGWPQGRGQLASDGVSAKVCQHRWSSNRALAGIKHLNRLDQVMARNEWTDPKVHEGIMLSQEGYVISGVMSNLFIQTNGGLITPRLDQCGIHGTMAQQVSAIAKQLGISVLVQDITLDELVTADGVFFTNSLNGIWPLVALLPDKAIAKSKLTLASSSAAAGANWVISPLINKLQKVLRLSLAEQSRVGDLC